MKLMKELLTWGTRKSPSFCNEEFGRDKLFTEPVEARRLGSLLESILAELTGVCCWCWLNTWAMEVALNTVGPAAEAAWMGAGAGLCVGT